MLLNALNNAFKTPFSFCSLKFSQNTKVLFFRPTVSQKCFVFDGLFFRSTGLMKLICVDGEIFNKKQKRLFSTFRFHEVEKIVYTFLSTSRFNEIEKKLTDRFTKKYFDRWVKKVSDRFAELNSCRWSKKVSDQFAKIYSCRSDQKSILLFLLKVVSLKRIWLKNKHCLELNKACFMTFYYRSFDFCTFLTTD